MDINTAISAEDLASLTARVEAYNRSLAPGRVPQADLGKDDFLKLLITQLSHQDPTQPLEDREFVAQMAQFSTLEQMTNMTGELSKLLGLLARSQAVNLLGKTVEIAVTDGQANISGRVEAISGDQYPQVLVGGRYYDVSQVLSVKE
jgi:flagellar basal-body rod modification protein FlgD